MHFSVYLLLNCAFRETNKTKHSRVVIQQMKKKMLEVAVDWILRRFAAFCPLHLSNSEEHHWSTASAAKHQHSVWVE